MPTIQDADVLGRALRKRAAGYGTTNSEKRAIYDFERGRISRDHFSGIHTPPLRPVRGSVASGEAGVFRTLQQGKDSITLPDVEAGGVAGAGSIDQPTFEAMLEAACDTLFDMIGDCLFDAVYDVATFAAADAIAALPTDEIETCEGPIEVYTP